MSALIIEDTRQQLGKHKRKNKWWKAHGIDVVRHSLETGDYAAPGSAALVDTKANLAELVMDLGSDHRRFRDELVRARDAGQQLTILIESNARFNDLGLLARWPGRCSGCEFYRHHECHPSRGSCLKYRSVPRQGSWLALTISTVSERYGARFMFCDPQDSARIVCELLGVRFKDGK